MVTMDATTATDTEFFDEAGEGTGPASEGGEETVVELVDSDGRAFPPGEPSIDSTRSNAEEDEANAVADGLLSEQARYAKWQARRPPVAHLKAGVVFAAGNPGPLPLFDIGDRVIVEQRTTLLDQQPDPLDPDHVSRHPWLRTIVGRVRSIDDDAGTVIVVEEGQDARWVHVAHFTMNDPDNTAFFLAPSKYGDPFDISAVKTAEKEAARKAAAIAASMPGAPVKRGRGRPKGSLNRPKEEIEAERKALREHRDARKVRSKARRGTVG